MKTFFNPLNETTEIPATDVTLSTSSLLNGIAGECPKCKTPFGSAIVNSDAVYYCERCRVSQPITQ